MRSLVKGSLDTVRRWLRRLLLDRAPGPLRTTSVAVLSTARKAWVVARLGRARTNVAASKSNVPRAGFVWDPALARALSPHHRQMVALATSVLADDFFVVSFSLTEPPLADQLADLGPCSHVILREDMLAALRGGAASKEPWRGRLVRLLPAPAGRLETRPAGAALIPAAVTFEGPEIVAQSTTTAPANSAGWNAPLWQAVADGPFLIAPERSPGRPRVLVLPVFMAVGGVERNTVEIMERLADRYEFVVVSTERPTAALGSLHESFAVRANGLFELAELAAQPAFPALLQCIHDAYKPDLVWVCNGSPWQCHFSGVIREVFADAAIVDQSVYDTKVGWIEWYGEKGIQMYDHYIAVNEAIRRTFVDDRHIDPSRISLIYSAVSTEAFHPERVGADQKARIRERFGLRADDAVLVWMGRLHTQKRPMLFLRAARELASRGLRARFLMFGDGPLRDRVEAFVESGEVPGLSWIPFVEHTAEIWACASGLIFTSEYEALPVAMIEAMCMGVPVCATDTGDIRLFLERYRCGDVFPVRSGVAAVASAVERWLARHDQLAAAAREAAPRVRAFFDSRTIAEQYYSCFEHLIKGR